MLVEEAIRDIATQRPHLSVSVALRLADHPEVPMPPDFTWVTSSSKGYSIQDLAEWAWGVPTVSVYLSNHKPINAIKEIRSYSGCGLKEAKDAYDYMLKMPQYLMLAPKSVF